MTTTPGSSGDTGSTTEAPDAPGPQDGPYAAHEGGPRVSRADVTDLSRLRRTVGPDRKIGLWRIVLARSAKVIGPSKTVGILRPNAAPTPAFQATVSSTVTSLLNNDNAGFERL